MTRAQGKNEAASAMTLKIQDTNGQIFTPVPPPPHSSTGIEHMAKRQGQAA
jgi:hypothetical protein